MNVIHWTSPENLHFLYNERSIEVQIFVGWIFIDFTGYVRMLSDGLEKPEVI